MTAGEVLTYVLTGFGGAAITAAVLMKGLGRIIASTIEQQFKHIQDKALETLRSELAQRNELLSAALSFRNTESLAAQERRLRGVETLWQEILRLRKLTATALFPYSILVPSEYGEHAPRLLTSVPSSAALINELQLDGAVEQVRPFVGERLWVTFYMCRAVIIRAAVRVAWAKEEGKPIPIWHRTADDQPEHILSIAKQVLSDEQIQSSAGLQLSGIQTLIELMEQQLLLDIDRRISGASTADVTITEGLRFAQAIADGNRLPAKPK